MRFTGGIFLNRLRGELYLNGWQYP